MGSARVLACCRRRLADGYEALGHSLNGELAGDFNLPGERPDRAREDACAPRLQPHTSDLDLTRLRVNPRRAIRPTQRSIRLVIADHLAFD